MAARLEPNFWDNATPVPFAGCFLWLRGKNNMGYGQLFVKGKMVLAHRRAWELENGPIPEGTCVLHSCDTPLCVNPRHLFLGTMKDNQQDSASKGRAFFVSDLNPQKLKWRCPKGHVYDKENTRLYKGTRSCRTCDRERLAIRRHENKLTTEQTMVN